MRPFAELQARIRRELDEERHLEALRAYNRAMVGEFAKCAPLAGRSLLDLGASVHGFALEAALDQGVTRYEGIDFDINRHWKVPLVEFETEDGRSGRLQQMNAEQLDFADGSFDRLLTISTFEHFLQPDRVLTEMYRVLQPGGFALLSFEPVWTASYGHHLHHFGAEVSDRVPPWSHLYLDETAMRTLLGRAPWPEGARVGLEDALHWIYRGDGINRLPIDDLRARIAGSAFEVVWICPLQDAVSVEEAAVAAYLARVLPYAAEDLLTRGLSILLRKA